MLSYDSPIERIFAEACSKYLCEQVSVLPQVEAKTRKGLFRMDYVLSLGKRHIGIECDGADFHNFDKDLQRDAALLVEKHVDTVYRLRGTDLYHHVEDCLWVMSLKDTLFFSPRGRTILEFVHRLDIDLDLTTGESIRLHCLSSTPNRCLLSKDCKDLLTHHCSVEVIRRTIKEIR